MFDLHSSVFARALAGVLDNMSGPSQTASATTLSDESVGIEALLQQTELQQRRDIGPSWCFF